MIPAVSDIYFFNPTCEYAVANGKTSWQPNLLLQKMESDLSAIQLFLAKKEDVILVDSIPSEKYREKLQKVSFQLPSFVLKKDIYKAAFFSTPINSLKPWGWSPAAHQFLSPIKDSCSEKFKLSPVFSWKAEYRELYSKKFALSILKQFVSSNSKAIFLPEHLIPEICTSKTEINKLLQKWGKIMVKAPWSSSGRGLQPITKTPVHIKVWEKILGMIKDQGYVIVEPLFNKVLDFSFQFKMIDGEIKFLGISNFFTDKKGKYTGHFLNGLPHKTGNEVQDFQKMAIHEILNPMMKILGNSDLAKSYEGNFGVDALIYSDSKGNLKINPCLEMNIRQNMGLLSLQLEKLIVPEKKGIYRMFYQPETTFKAFADDMEKRFPLVISEQERIISGFLPLTEARADTMFGSYLLI